ncbi:uncharacterized protein LOC142988275 isoform X3 [Genypterus blacodes]|uniref:uncharacterized protein LOC142988275 isoform X3 n=1 Tax=Genypterus blacodes TaxID=154954 RepID=UPI003F760E12
MREKISGNWTDAETRALLFIRADGGVHRQLSGTVRDTAVYEKMAESMRARGHRRGKSQVITKLKILRRKFNQLSQQGGGWAEWPYFEMCQRIWGARSPAGNRSGETSGSPESGHHGGTLPGEAHAAPRKKKKKTTVMDQVTTLVSATVSQLREMDAAMQAQEEERLQRLMEHEREMQSGLLRQLEAMTERRDQDHQQRQLELLDRLLAKFPGPSGR